MLPLQTIKPHGLPGTLKFGLCLLRQLQVVRSMSLQCGLHLSTRGESLQSKLANRLQHGEAGLICLVRCLLEEIFIDQGSDPIQHRWHWIAKCGRNGLCCLECAAADEDREALEKPLFVWGEQVIAPLDSVAQGLLPGWRI